MPLNIPLLPQLSRADCLPACVEMVSRFLGRDVSRDWLSQILETTWLGTPGFKLLNLRDHGYDVVYASAMNERPLIEALAAGIPPIALVHTSALPHWKQATAHAVVVAEFGEQVVVNDPAFPTMPQVVPREAFMLAWSEFDYLYAIVRPR